MLQMSSWHECKLLIIVRPCVLCVVCKIFRGTNICLNKSTAEDFLCGLLNVLCVE